MQVLTQQDGSLVGLLTITCFGFLVCATSSWNHNAVTVSLEQTWPDGHGNRKIDPE